jgi:hypothetical protein
MQNIVGDSVKKGRRAVEALDSVLRGRGIPSNVRILVLRTCILHVLTYGCEVWGMDSTSGVNRLQAILSQCLRRLVGMGAKAPRVATTPLLRDLGIAPIQVTAAAARTRVFLKAPTLNTCINDLVGQPSRLRPNTWTYGTVRWHVRHVLIRGVFIPMLHMLGTHCHNTARAFPRGPLNVTHYDSIPHACISHSPSSNPHSCHA